MAEAVILGEHLGPEHPVLGVEEAQRAALQYISMGWAVTAGPGLDAAGICSCPLKDRCRNPGKHAIAGWGNETRRTASAEEAERHWSVKNPRWRDRPVDQVFIVPYLSGLVVADVDNESAWLEMPEEDRPNTLWQASGSGRGGHALYSYDWDMNDDQPPRLPGKLVGGAGEVKFRGIIAAAPSVHASGGRYRWSNWGTEIVPAPNSLIERRVVPSMSERDWASIADADKSEGWVALLFRSDRASMDFAGDAKSARPLVLFAVAASMGGWVEAGFITEDKVVEKLLYESERNGAMDKYGETELTRQIVNGINAGRMEIRS